MADSQTKDSMSAVPPPSFMGPQDMVTIEINPPTIPEEQGTSADTQTSKFVIHKHIITHYSEFFNAIFNSKFKEGLSQTVTFVDIQVELFALIVGWLYSGHIRSSASSSEADCSKLSILSQLWILGDRFVMVKFQEAIVEQVIAQFKAHNVAGLDELLISVYEVTDGDHSLGRAAINAAAAINDKAFEGILDNLSNSNPKIGLNIAMAMKKKMAKASSLTRLSDSTKTLLGPNWEEYDM